MHPITISSVILAVVASAVSPSQAYAFLAKRTPGLDGYGGIVKEILQAIGVFLPDNANAWDYEALPDMCAIEFSTEDGGNCKTSVTCNDGVTREYNDWSVCYVGGRQYITDYRIGKFSVAFTKKDGSEGEGLTDPVLALASVDNWRKFLVSELAYAHLEATRCLDNNGADCGFGPWLCTYGDTGSQYIFDSRYKPWKCGMPRIGRGGNDIDSTGPVNAAGYRPGRCGVHVTQYQKPNPVVDSYSLNITIYDANEDVVGQTPGALSSSRGVGVTSRLPWTVNVDTGAVDADPVSFAYSTQSWKSNDEQCTVGEYDSGRRDMDCAFIC